MKLVMNTSIDLIIDFFLCYHGPRRSLLNFSMDPDKIYIVVYLFYFGNNACLLLLN